MGYGRRRDVVGVCEDCVEDRVDGEIEEGVERADKGISEISWLDGKAVLTVNVVVVVVDKLGVGEEVWGEDEISDSVPAGKSFNVRSNGIKVVVVVVEDVLESVLEVDVDGVDEDVDGSVGDSVEVEDGVVEGTVVVEVVEGKDVVEDVVDEIGEDEAEVVWVVDVVLKVVEDVVVEVEEFVEG
uniref:Uncharacterized protein n=1 Tax=Panagrolaimus superbus TaxID=310955 RepID=A0A914YUN4_9BILA